VHVRIVDCPVRTGPAVAVVVATLAGFAVPFVDEVFLSRAIIDAIGHDVAHLLLGAFFGVPVLTLLALRSARARNVNLTVLDGAIRIGDEPVMEDEATVISVAAAPRGYSVAIQFAKRRKGTIFVEAAT
jgi:hypothetical protein